MTFVVLGAAIVLLYAGITAWMAVVARRDPARTLRIGKCGRTPRRDVTAAEWIRRYVPWGTGAGLLVTLVRLLVAVAGRTETGSGEARADPRAGTMQSTSSGGAASLVAGG